MTTTRQPLTFAARIRRTRRAAGKTQREFVETELGGIVNQATYAQWETGDRMPSSSLEYAAVARALDLPTTAVRDIASTGRCLWLGEMLRAERRSAGLSQSDAANFIGITQPSYCRIENDESAPKDRHRPAIAKLLGMDVGDVQVLIIDRILQGEEAA